MRELFQLDARRLGSGPVVFCWAPDSATLAAYGENKLLSLFNKYGELLDQVELANQSNSERCLCTLIDFEEMGTECIEDRQGSDCDAA